MFRSYDKRRASEPDKPRRIGRPRSEAEIAAAIDFKRWRLAHGLSVVEAARLLGVSPITVYHWQAGVNAIRPSVVAMMALLDETR